MRTDGQIADIDNFFLQNEIVSDKIKYNIKKCIGATTGGIAECLFIYQFTEGRIKNIYYPDDSVPVSVKHLFHKPAKIQVELCRYNLR